MSTLTEAGHAVAAVDLFTGTERGLQLPYDDAGRARGFALLRDLQAESLVEQIRQTRDLLEPGPVGIVGFSVGGFMALVAATHLTFEEQRDRAIARAGQSGAGEQELGTRHDHARLESRERQIRDARLGIEEWHLRRCAGGAQRGREHGKAALEGYLEVKTAIMRYA